MTFRFCVAHCVSCYSTDFVVEAETEAEAEKLAQAALDAGELDHVETEAEWDTADQWRIVPEGATDDPGTLHTLAHVIRHG